jgi:hypothetical protein
MSCTFYTGVDSSDSSLRSISVLMTKNQFHIGDKVTTKNATVTAVYANGKTKKVTSFTSNASKISTKKKGTKTLKITYKEGGTSLTSNVSISVVKKPTKVKKLKASIKASKSKAKLTISWKKAAVGTSYEISYGKTKKKHAYISGTTKTKMTYTDYDGIFKKGKTYYIHVKTGVKFNGKKEYSDYATVKVKAK